VVYVSVGRQTLEVTFDDARSASRDITVVAGTDTEVQIAPPPPVEAAAPKLEAKPRRDSVERRASRGLPPSVALVGAAVAVGLAGAGAWSGFNTKEAHEKYVENPTHDAFTEGQSKQLRTNILFGSAIAVGAATAVVAIWWTRWGSSEAPAVSLAPSRGGGLVTYGARF
jgi:F0F1-type ATP synthase membrane subunit c/vacuolar-type H+-ATPase subunit K